jgi:hypothetical protein
VSQDLKHGLRNNEARSKFLVYGVRFVIIDDVYDDIVLCNTN